MKAAYFYGVHDIRLEEVPMPEITDDDILVKVKLCAICGTDLRIFNFGHFKIKEGDKRVLGHEVVGEIAKVGKNVTGYHVGQRVATPPNFGCGHCEMCRKGYGQLCPDYDAFGINIDGGFEEYMVVPGHAIAMGNVVTIPDNCSFEQAVLAEPLSCCYNSYKALKTEPGDTLLVIGAGPIGALHCMINKLAGATKVMIADISQDRLDLLKEIDESFILINSGKVDLYEEVMKLTDGRGVDVVITACSVPQLQNEALRLATKHGRINFFGGLPKGKENVELLTNNIHYKELTVVGTTGSTLVQYINSLNIIASGALDVAPLITKKFSIDQVNDAFAYAATGKGMKTVVAF